MADNSKPKKDGEPFVLEDVSGLYGNEGSGKSDPSISLEMEPAMSADEAPSEPVAEAQPSPSESDAAQAVENTGATTVLKLDDSVQLTSAADSSQDASVGTASSSEGGIELGDGGGDIVLESHKHEGASAEAATTPEASSEAAPEFSAAPEEPAATEAPAIEFGKEITAPIDVSAVGEEQPAAEAPTEQASEIQIEAPVAVEAPKFDFAADGTVSVESPQVETQVASAPEFTASSEVSSQQNSVSDGTAEAELPYLFGKDMKKPAFDALAAMGRAIGDAIVPGGAASSPDLETLKKFLLLREQDVVALSTQLHAAIEHIKSLESQLGQEQSKVEALENENRNQKNLIDDFESKKESEVESLRFENQELQKQLREKSEKTKMMELQVRDTIAEIDRIKERVRLDIRRIRVREKELENRLEVVKKDAEQLILTRETKIVDLKRKMDTLEFNMDLLKEQMNREQEKARLLKQKLMKATAAFKNAEEMMTSEAEPVQEDEKTVQLKAS